MGDAAASGLRALVAFTRVLRASGLVVGTERVVAYARAAAELGPADLEDLYWAGRLTLVGGRKELSVYDRAFAATFRGERPRAEAPRTASSFLQTAPGRAPGWAANAAPAVEEMEGSGAPLARTAASPIEVLRRKSFGEYSEQEHARARARSGPPGGPGPRAGGARGPT